MNKATEALTLHSSFAFIGSSFKKLIAAALCRFGWVTCGDISFWHTFTLLSWRDILAGRREDEWRVGGEVGTFSFILNEQMPGVT